MPMTPLGAAKKINKAKYIYIFFFVTHLYNICIQRIYMLVDLCFSYLYIFYIHNLVNILSAIYQT